MPDSSNSAIHFLVADEHYAVPADSVGSIIKQGDITSVAGTNTEALGIMNLRGRVIPVIGFRHCLGIEYQAATDQTRIMVMTFNGTTVGVRVDEVFEVFTLNPDTVQPSPFGNSGYYGTTVEGIIQVDDELITLIDMAALIDSSDIKLTAPEPTPA